MLHADHLRPPPDSVEYSRWSLNQALEAIGALILVTIAKIDYRDFSADFPLYAVGRLGGDVTEAISAAMSSSEPQARASFASRADRATRMALRDCGLLSQTPSLALSSRMLAPRPRHRESAPKRASPSGRGACARPERRRSGRGRGT